MNENEIITLWLKGYSKYKIAEEYKKRYNQYIKVIRSNPRNRHSGNFISYYNALNKVEITILNYIKNKY